MGLKLSSDKGIEQIARIIAVGEVIAVLVLAVALLVPRAAKKPAS